MAPPAPWKRGLAPGALMRLISSILALLLLPAVSLAAPLRSVTLDNGFRAFLIENHANPLVSMTVFVRVGSVDEDYETSGLSHLIEHLVFNGTTRRTQERIYAEEARLGLFEHASTTKEATIFTFISPKENIDGALDLLSDILFNSTIPPEKLEKERRVVIEEMRRARASPGYLPEEFMEGLFFKGSSYALPVLGREGVIREIPRDEILRHYRRYYRPDNMVGLFIGDFDSDEMERRVARFFSERVKSEERKEKELRRALWPPEPPYGVFRTKGRVSSPYIEIAFLGREEDFIPLNLMSHLLVEARSSRLSRALKGRARISGRVEMYSRFSTLRISAIGVGMGVDDLLARLEEAVREAARRGFSGEELESAKSSLLTQMAILSEQFQYFAYLNAPYFIEGRLRELLELPGRVEKTTLEELSGAARRILSRYLVAIVEPEGGLIKGRLKNGLTVISQHNPYSTLVAINIMARGRSFVEPEAGLVEFLGRLIPTEGLEGLGAKARFFQDPLSPFGDWRLSRRFSDLKVEVRNKNYTQALKALARSISRPDLSRMEVVRQEMLASLKLLKDSPRAVAQGLFYQRLGIPTIFGTEESISSITGDDLMNFHRRYFSPQNLTLTIIGNLPAQEMFQEVSRWFSGLEGAVGAIHELPPQLPSPKEGEVEEELGRGQGYIIIGGLVPKPEGEDRLALSLAFSILSSRLSYELRERRGLAYSVGASLHQGEGFAWFELYMGTSPQRIREAKEGMLSQLKRIIDGGVGPEEVAEAVGAIMGRRLTRLMPSINRAFLMNLSELEEGDPLAYRSLPQRLRAMTHTQINAILKRHLTTEGLITVLVR